MFNSSKWYAFIKPGLTSVPAAKGRIFCWTGRDRFEFLSPCNSYSSRCLVRTSQNTWYPEKNEATGSSCITSANSNASSLLFGNQWHREYDAELLIWYHDVLFTWQNVATLPCKMKRHIITLQHRNRQSVRQCVGLLEPSLAATTVVINSMLESETVFVLWQVRIWRTWPPRLHDSYQYCTVSETNQRKRHQENVSNYSSSFIAFKEIP